MLKFTHKHTHDSIQKLRGEQKPTTLIKNQHYFNV